MSYDIYLLSPEDARDPESSVERLDEAVGPGDEAQQARKKRLAEALVAENSALEVFEFDHHAIAVELKTTLDEARRAYSHIELSVPKTGIQITIFANWASVTVPYWHAGPAAEPVFAEVHRATALLVSQGGYRIYDPQIEQVVDDLSEVLDEVIWAYTGAVGSVPILRETGESPAKPWWKFW